MKFEMVATVLLLCCACTMAAEKIDGIIARVDDAVITQSDIEEATFLAVKEIRSQYPSDQWEEKIKELKNQVLMQIMNEYICVRAARDLKITVMDEEVEGHIQNLWKKSGITSDAVFQEELKKEGMTIEELRDAIRRQVLTRKVIQREVYSKAAVNEADIQQYYNQNKDIYHQEAQVRIALILVETKEKTSEDWESAKARADTIYKAIQSGSDFKEQLRQLTGDPDADGDIGFIEKGKSLPEIESVAFSLQQDEISQPFKTEHGWNIIRVLERKPESIRPLEEVRPEIESLLQKLKSRDAEQQWIDKQRNKTFIEIVTQ